MLELSNMLVTCAARRVCKSSFVGTYNMVAIPHIIESLTSSSDVKFSACKLQRSNLLSNPDGIV